MSNHYKSVQAESFAMFDTVADDWEVCEINGLVAGRPNYKIPYKTVLAHSRNMVAREFIEGFTCELCGHPILNLHYIQCDDKEICLCVGSDCVNTFKGAEFTEKAEKRFREEQTRQMFEEWFTDAWVEFNKMQRGWMGGKTYTYYKELRNIKRHVDGWTGTYQVTNPSELTTRKLLGIMKRGAKYDLVLPELYFKLIEKPPKREKSK